MTNLSKYFPYVLVVCAFILGMLISKGPDKELLNKFAQEREVYMKVITERDAKIKTLDSLQAEIRERMIQDSARFSMALKAKDTRINTLQIRLKDAEKIKTASVPTLDSLRTAMYGASPLPSVSRE